MDYRCVADLFANVLCMPEKYSQNQPKLKSVFLFCCDWNVKKSDRKTNLTDLPKN